MAQPVGDVSPEMDEKALSAWLSFGGKNEMRENRKEIA